MTIAWILVEMRCFCIIIIVKMCRFSANNIVYLWSFVWRRRWSVLHKILYTWHTGTAFLRLYIVTIEPNGLCEWITRSNRVRLSQNVTWFYFMSSSTQISPIFVSFSIQFRVALVIYSVVMTAIVHLCPFAHHSHNPLNILHWIYCRVMGLFNFFFFSFQRLNGKMNLFHFPHVFHSAFNSETILIFNVKFFITICIYRSTNTNTRT